MCKNTLGKCYLAQSIFLASPSLSPHFFHLTSCKHWKHPVFIHNFSFSWWLTSIYLQHRETSKFTTAFLLITIVLIRNLLSHRSGGLPQFQDASCVHRWVDPAHKIEVPDIQAAIDAHCQSNRSQQLVAVREAITAGARDAAPAAVPHDARDYWRLLCHKDVFPAAFVKDACEQQKTNRYIKSR